MSSLSQIILFSVFICSSRWAIVQSNNSSSSRCRLCIILTVAQIHTKSINLPYFLWQST